MHLEVFTHFVFLMEQINHVTHPAWFCHFMGSLAIILWVAFDFSHDRLFYLWLLQIGLAHVLLFTVMHFRWSSDLLYVFLEVLSPCWVYLPVFHDG